MLLVPPDYHERLLIVGANGTGKSELSYTLEDAGNYRKVYYIDHKGDCTPHQPFTIVRKPDDRWGLRQRRIVYRPAHGSWLHSDEGLAQFLERLFMQAVRDFDHKRRRSRAPFVVVIPEIMLFGPKSQKVIAEMASAGRNYEILLIIETQRPRRIPVVVRSEAWRIYAFPLGYEDDELEVIKYAKGRLTLDAFRKLEDSITEADPYPFYEIIKRTQKGAQISIRRCGSLELAA